MLASAPHGPGKLRTQSYSVSSDDQSARALRGESLSQRTLVLIKPDGIRRGLIGDVVSRIERKGLRIVAMELRTLDPDTAQTHYAEHVGKPFFGSLVEFITSGPLVALVAEGERAVEAAPARQGGRSDRGAAGYHPRRLRP